MGLALSLVRFLLRLAVALAVALVVALVLALVRDGTSFVDNLRISLYCVGAITLVLAAAGNSPSMRMGANDPWLASFFPKVIPQLGKPYSGTTLSTTALLLMTALAVLALAVLVDSRA